MMPKVKAGSITLNYDISGEGDPLLLIMGFGLPGAAWIPALPSLAGLKCIYFDNRGTGESDNPEAPYLIADLADDASGLLSALGIARAKVYGVSMGGMVAQELALRHPEQVEKLVLGCTMAGGPNAKLAVPEVLQSLLEGARLMEDDPGKALDVILPILYPPEYLAANPATKELMLAALAMAPPTPPVTAERQFMALAQFDTYERLSQIHCPVLIIHGEHDVLIPPENAAIIKRQLPQAEVWMLPEAGHNYFAADPAEIHSRVVRWLQSS